MTVPYGKPSSQPQQQQQQQQQQRAVNRANRRRRNLTGLPNLPQKRKLERIPEDAETGADVGAGASAQPRPAPPPPSPGNVSARPAPVTPPYATIRSASRVPLAPTVHFSPGPNFPDAMVARAAAATRRQPPPPTNATPTVAAAAKTAATAAGITGVTAAAHFDNNTGKSAAMASPATVSHPLRHSTNTRLASDVVVIRRGANGSTRFLSPILANDGTLIGYRTHPFTTAEPPQHTPEPEELCWWLRCLLFLCCCPYVTEDNN